MDWITDKVAIGNYQEAQDVEFLRGIGFGSVLSLIGVLVGKSASDLGIRQLEVVTLLDGAGNDLSRFQRAVDALGRLVAEAPPVLVHCRAGWSRSPAVVTAYLMQYCKMSTDAALGIVCAKRQSTIVSELKLLLAEFEKTLGSKRHTPIDQ